MNCLKTAGFFILSFMSLNVFAAQVVCSKTENYEGITQYASIQSLNKILSNTPNAVLSGSPVFYQWNDSTQKYYVTCVNVNYK